MKPIDSEVQGRYLRELSICLRREGFGTPAIENDQLPVTFDGKPLCQMVGLGGVRYRKEDVATEAAADALEKATDIAVTVAEYMKLMENASPLIAHSLDESYKLLADYNGIVLAGHDANNGYGVQFVTWEWSYDRKAVGTGHYTSHHYAAAKEDFAVRSGLVDKQKLFSPEQLTEMYRCMAEVRNSINENLTYEQERELERIQEQIADIVPDLSERLAMADNNTQSMQQTM
jgi:hypothetical protein